MYFPLPCFLQLRSFAAVLARRVALKIAPNQTTTETVELTLWDVVPEETRQVIQTNFLTALKKETNKSARNKICDTISEIARVTALNERKPNFYIEDGIYESRSTILTHC